MKSNLLTGLAIVSLSFPFSLLAGDDVSEPMVVTATRAEQPADQSLASVSIIDREAIERSQAPDLLELLRLEAGLDVARAGGPGGQTSVFMRGTNSNHVLVLIDGIRVSAAGTGAFAWEILDPALIERIEIVRGPRAARYGSDAIGGVIQIFTRRANGPSARAAYGRYRDRSLSVGMGGEGFGLSVSGRRVGGFSAQNERGFAFDPDDDGFKNLGATAYGTHPMDSGTFSWTGRINQGDIEFDQGESEFLNYAFQSEYRHDTRGPWQWSLSTGLYRDRLDTETPFSFSEVVTRRIQAGWQAERLLTEGTLWLTGIDAWRESGVSRSDWAENRYNLGAWTGLHGARDRLDWETSLRVDEDEQFGSALTGNLAAGWRFDQHWRVYASAGRAFRAPNFNQLYSPGFGGQFAGNPDLAPETSWTYEAGADFTPDTRQRITLNVFETRIDDLIDFSGEDFQAINIRRARIRGAELSHELNLDHWRTRTSYTWQDPEDRDSGEPLLRRAEHKASLAADYLFANGGWAGAELVHTGSRPDLGEELPSYTLLNLRMGYPITEGLRLEARLENAIDRDYEPLVGFNAHGRSLFVAINWEG